MGRAPTRAFTRRPDGREDGLDIGEESERWPSSLAPIVPILRAANEIEEENPRVAYLCTCSHRSQLVSNLNYSVAAMRIGC